MYVQSHAPHANHVQRPEPPQVEWWDMALLPTKSYDDVPISMQSINDVPPDASIVEHEDSPIDHLVQHPIPIPVSYTHL